MEQLEIYPSELSVQLESTIGAFKIVGNYRPNNTRTNVWKIQSNKNNEYYYLKTYSRIQRWHPEVYAYRNWINHLRPYVPELIETFEGGNWHAILITSISGTIMREVNLDADSLHAAYFKAGQLTKLIHEGTTGEWFGRPDKNGNPIEIYSENDPVIYVYNSMTEIFNYCMQANLLAIHEIELFEWASKNVDVFKGSKPVPISWDSTPGNWLVDDKGKFSGMIDFENMLWGIDVDHFSILFERYFIENELAMKAFFEGYGTETLQHKNIHMTICCIKLAIGDIFWGAQNNVPKVNEYGRNLLKRLYENNEYIGL
ncbi:aminoglycoside phosphotransferase family protein [Paenibacillus macerans]|uniref:aminoglycoside phosphotransferase family protein n=1 Tax=Paenibacillus macerans TaxID=44252 RepID=UPI00203BE3A5|nr:aminoglycoside phosphotransferase family protein [Paenibacillus macerans]MCM3700537.1 aminoglycoside phosphotransferase family protein [Paenibacillus macerans]